MSDVASPSTPPEPNAQVFQRFLQAYQDYEKSLQSIWQATDNRTQASDAYRRFAQQVQESFPTSRLHEQLTQAYQDWVKAAQMWSVSEDARTSAVDAYQRFLKVLQEANSTYNAAGVQERIAESYRSYLQELRTALSVDTMQSQVEQAYQNFVRTIQTIWKEIDAQAVDMSLLALVGQMFQAAANMTAAAALQLQQQRALLPAT